MFTDDAPMTIRPDSTLAESDLPSDQFLIETHFANAMPSAHWHDHIEINYLQDGQMEYLLNGRRVTLQAQRLGVFWAAIQHQAIAVEDRQRLTCIYVPIGVFLGLAVEPSFRAAVLRGELVQTRDPCPSDGARLTELTAVWGQSGPALRQIYRDEMLLRLRRMSLEPLELPQSGLSGAAPRGAAAHSVRHVERMTAYINDHLGHQLTVSDVAAASGLHPTSARAAFGRVLGITIGTYLRRQRLSHAMRLLAETDHEIARIAHLSGYSSLPRLYDAFQEQVGRTPRDFRRDSKRRSVDTRD